MGRINLTRIYTKVGDGGTTHLGDMSMVPKTDPRIEAYGTIDELNAHVGVAVATAPLPAGYGEILKEIQNDLFDLGADLCLPPGSREGKLTVRAEQTRRLEQLCDEFNERLEPLTSFVLPGGSQTSSLLHLCRTVCRRAERRALGVDEVNPEVHRYLNRLSDLFFILARAANAGQEVVWMPGRSQADDGEEP